VGIGENGNCRESRPPNVSHVSHVDCRKRKAKSWYMHKQNLNKLIYAQMNVSYFNVHIFVACYKFTYDNEI